MPPPPVVALRPTNTTSKRVSFCFGYDPFVTLPVEWY